MEHLFEYESWSDYKTPAELKSRIKSEGRKRAEVFFQKRTYGGEASDIFTDDEEFKQDMKEIFFDNGCNTPNQLDFLLSLDLPKEDLRKILDVNINMLTELKAMEDYGSRLNDYKDKIKTFIDNLTQVNQTLEDLIG